MICSSFFALHPGWGAESAISALVPFCLGTLPSAPDSRGDISALRRSWKVFLGSKFAYASSTIRKTKQLMVLATSGKVIPKCQKNRHSAKIIVITSSISPVELLRVRSETWFRILERSVQNPKIFGHFVFSIA